MINNDDAFFTARAMRMFGGSFVRELGRLIEVADADNTQRILTAWPEYFAEYGPGTEFFNSAKTPIERRCNETDS